MTGRSLALNDSSPALAISASDTTATAIGFRSRTGFHRTGFHDTVSLRAPLMRRTSGP